MLTCLSCMCRQHMALTIKFEKAVQAVDGSVSVPYWDYTIDAESIFMDKDKSLSEFWLQADVRHSLTHCS